MKKILKKAMAGALSVCLITTCVPGGNEFGGYTQTNQLVQAATTKSAVSGTCGKKATWKYNTSTKTLTIGGSGAMYNYEKNNDELDGAVDTTPWSVYKNQIKKVVVGDKVTQIGEDAFSGCVALTEVKLGKNVKK